MKTATLLIVIAVLSSAAAQAQNDQAARQAAAWKAIVDQIAAMNPGDHAMERFGALIFGYPGDRPPVNKRAALCAYVLTEATKGNVPVEEIARASRLCAGQ